MYAMFDNVQKTILSNAWLSQRTHGQIIVGRFVPPQRWLASVERGAVVMLYHPCTPPDTVDMLRTILTGCMRWGL